MSTQQPPEDDHVNSNRSVAQLAWAIESSVGQFKLILSRCNYASLRDRLIQKLREICQVEIRVLAVQQSRKTLYTAIQEEFGEEIPACVMVVGLESVQNLSVMLTSANQVREEFRKNFAFPLVLWIDDEIYKQLIQLAPDLESWATTRNFDISTQELVDFIIETANQWFSKNLKLSKDVYIKLENELETAQRYLLNQSDVYNLEIKAKLESLLGFVKQINNHKDSALEHYHKALELWQESNNLEKQATILGEIGVCYYLKAFKHQDINHPDWQATWYYVQEYIKFINQFQSPDLIANAVVKFGDILRDLQKWETLQSLSEEALVIHQTNNQPRELAKDYSFLAEVALAQKDWVENKAIEVNTLEGHSSSVYSVGFSPDGKTLASGSNDKTIKLWDVSTGKAIKTLTGHSSTVLSVGFSPDGKTLASGSNDKTVILWDLDFDNLLHSSCNLLNNYFIAHPEVLEELESCQTPSQKALGATVLVIQGEKLARNDDINGAVEKFRQAQQWDNKLNFDFQARAKEFLNKGKAEGSVDEGNSRLQEKKFKEALADYTEALKFDPKVEIPVDSWNTLCRQASLQEGNGMELMIFRLPVFIEPALQSLTSVSIYYYLQKQAADVLSACEQAVAFAPEDGNIRDSRGLARALTGNYQGAIEDFEAYIAQTDDKDSKAQRQRWVKDLRAGKNPFRDAEIKKLQN
ncbi:hypothetical protein [Nostoc sp.]|uniref:WD40 domain-containing protein n=1 Tax=Nostoc sp. TaxID=1180 RepID=UPI002FF92FDB